MAKTDLEIAQECVMEPIEEVAKKVGIQPDMLENYGSIKLNYLLISCVRLKTMSQVS